jgi:3-phenylpropionate/trans-cinnamate dioxygenase ferredoxin subunit
MGTFVKAARADEIGPGKSKAVDVAGKKIAVFNLGGTYYAIDDSCTHHGGPLSEGILEGKEVVCPWHGAVFEVTSGAVLGAPAPTGVQKYNVRVSGAEIEIEIET